MMEIAFGETGLGKRESTQSGLGFVHFVVFEAL
jgi:hypothetical protein